MINTFVNKSRAVIKNIHFGSGDVGCVSIYDNNGAGLMFFETDKGEVGRTIKENPSKEELFQDIGEVILFFDNIESLNSTIRNLESVREKFTNKE